MKEIRLDTADAITKVIMALEEVIAAIDETADTLGKNGLEIKVSTGKSLDGENQACITLTRKGVRG